MYPHSVCIFGAGYIGTRLLEYFGNRAYLAQVDVTNLQAVRAVVAENKPLVLINAAAKTHTDDLEKPENQALAYQVNVQGAANCGLVAHEHDAFLVHLSTGMLFETSTQAITEEEVPNPKSYYAWTKAWADAQLQLFAERDGILIARIQLPLSNMEHPRNVLTKLISFTSAVDVPSSFTVLEDCFPALEQLIAQRNSGIYNLVNPGSISFYTISQMLRKQGLIQAEQLVTKITGQEMQAKTAERGGAYQPFILLDTNKLVRAGIIVKPIQQAVEYSITHYVA